jgi:hypothetical protein
VAALSSHCPWTAEQDALLLQLRRRGVSWKLIARMFDRSEITVRFRFYAVHHSPLPPHDVRRV